MHQMETFRNPVRETSCVHTVSLRSLCVRMVSSRTGRVRRTSRKARRVVSLDELSSIQVIDLRLVHNERAAKVSAVMFGFLASIPR